MSTTVCSSFQEIPSGYFFADCAISGGNLQNYLRDVLSAADGRLCIRLQPVYTDFPLPCPSGIGTPLTIDELKALYTGAPCFFSEALCTEYFTYLKNGQAHVVLFDSIRSLREKYRTAVACGIPMILIEDPNLREKLIT